MERKAILEEARKRCDENDRLPHAGEYACACWDDTPEMIREIEEIEMETQSQRYQGNHFRDSHMRPIKIDETLTLRQALDALDVAIRDYSNAMRREGMVCGAELYKLAQEETKTARRVEAVTRANAQAALYRETGRWPHSFYELGLR